MFGKVLKSILINRIPEESTVREESLQVEVGGELVNQSKDTVEETGEPDQDINTSGEKDTNNTQVSQHITVTGRDTDKIPPGQNPLCSFLYSWTKSPP